MSDITTISVVWLVLAALFIGLMVGITLERRNAKKHQLKSGESLGKVTNFEWTDEGLSFSGTLNDKGMILFDKIEPIVDFPEGVKKPKWGSHDHRS